MILFPLAELKDLEVFLRGGYKIVHSSRDPTQVYNFSSTFPDLTEAPILHRELIRELFEIASALLWLHEELRIYGSQDSYLAHMNLKPENILLLRDRASRIGKWMLSDFGVSLFDRAGNTRPSRYYSIRDIGPRLTSRTQHRPERGHGSYQPPEVDFDAVDGRKCDVWSFGGILVDVLAFALGRTAGLVEVQRARFNGRNDFFYQEIGGLAPTRGPVTNFNTEVKTSINTWLTERIRTDGEANPWVKDYVKIVGEVLVPDTAQRPGIRTIVDGLGSLNLRHSPQTADRNNLEPSELSRTNGDRELNGMDERGSLWHGMLDAQFEADQPRSSPVAHRPPVILAPPPVGELPHRVHNHLPAPLPLPPSTGNSNRHTPEPNLEPNSITIWQSPKYITFLCKNLKTAQGVESLVISSAADRVAVLTHHSVRLFDLTNSKSGVTLTEPTQGSQVRLADLSSRTTWTKISPSTRYLTVYGLVEQSLEKAVSYHEIQSPISLSLGHTKASRSVLSTFKTTFDRCNCLQNHKRTWNRKCSHAPMFYSRVEMSVCPCIMTISSFFFPGKPCPRLFSQKA